MDNPRFLSLEDVAEELNVNMPLARALVQNGELRAIKVGGRGIWRVERSALEEYIQRMYAQTRETIGLEAEEGSEAKHG
ncbi:MAG: helix-turn-helix domain-containing protein [Arthrobacter sp.]|jgi:excisionase family DNA binding protein|nr:helix-turn-helix domain-containing protein [Arthrobacter sp.]